MAGVAPAPAVPLAARDAGDRRVEQVLDRFSRHERDRIVEKTAEKYGLTPGERERVFAALTEVENAKAKEYWEKRGPAEAAGVIGKVAIGTGATVAAGLAGSSGALFPAAMSSAVGLGAKLAVLHRKLGHALQGRAALELSQIEEQRRKNGQPSIGLEKGFAGRLAEKIASRLVKKYAQEYGLDDRQVALVSERVQGAATSKKRELWEKRLGVEIAAITGASAVSAAAGLALGLIAAPGVGLLALSALFGSLVSVALSGRKMVSNLEATAHATIEELARDADPASQLAERAGNDAHLRQKKALETADRITGKYSARYALDAVETKELSALLESLALLKEKELWDMRLLPTLIAPVARGGSVAAVAVMAGLAGPPTATALVIGALAESAVSGVLLYKKLDQALEGAAYAFALGRGKTPA